MSILREQIYAEEKQYYNSQVTLYKEKIENNLEDLRVLKTKLDLLNHISGSVGSNDGRKILNGDINLLQSAINDLEKDNKNAQQNVNAYQSIVDVFNK